MAIGRFTWHRMGSIAWNNNSICYCSTWWLLSHSHNLVWSLWHLRAISLQGPLFHSITHYIPPIWMVIGIVSWHWMGSIAWNNHSICYCRTWWLLLHRHHLVWPLWHLRAISLQCTLFHPITHCIPPIWMAIGRFTWNWMGSIAWNNHSICYCSTWWLLSHRHHLVWPLWHLWPISLQGPLFHPITHYIRPIWMAIGRFTWHRMGSIAWNNHSICYCTTWWLLSHSHNLVWSLWHLWAISLQYPFFHSISHCIPPTWMAIGRFTWHWMGSIAWNNHSICYCSTWWLLLHRHHLVWTLWHLRAISLQCSLFHSITHCIPPIWMAIGRFTWHWMGSIAWNNHSICYCRTWWLLSHRHHLVWLSWHLRAISLQGTLFHPITHCIRPIWMAIGRFTWHWMGSIAWNNHSICYCSTQ
jgi:hypothetical protein